MIGRTIANYQVKSLLGRGGMGSVYRAYHVRLERDDAIKILADGLSGDEEFTRRFLREARVMARLSHPNLTRVFDCGEVDGRPYLAMELLEGETLRQKLKRGALPEAEAILIAQGVLAALACAHAHGVVHRDVKPANVFVCNDGTVKVMDFGIASAASEARLTTTGSLMGTAEYMSPEQAESMRVDARSDLYSAGILLYEMLTGNVPFSGPSAASVLFLHVHRPAPGLPESVAVRLRALVERALAKDPADRFQTAQEMLDALESRFVIDLPPLIELPAEIVLRMAWTPGAAQRFTVQKSRPIVPPLTAESLPETAVDREAEPAPAPKPDVPINAGLASHQESVPDKPEPASAAKRRPSLLTWFGIIAGGIAVAVVLLGAISFGVVDPTREWAPPNVHYSYLLLVVVALFEQILQRWTKRSADQKVKIGRWLAVSGILLLALSNLPPGYGYSDYSDSYDLAPVPMVCNALFLLGMLLILPGQFLQLLGMRRANDRYFVGRVFLVIGILLTGLAFLNYLLNWFARFGVPLSLVLREGGIWIALLMGGIGFALLGQKVRASDP